MVDLAVKYCAKLILLSMGQYLRSIDLYGRISMQELHKATLIAMYQEIGLSTNAHIPLTSIQRHFPKHLRGLCKVALKELGRQGLITKHPTGGSLTYLLTNEGVLKIREILQG